MMEYDRFWGDFILFYFIFLYFILFLNHGLFEVLSFSCLWCPIYILYIPVLRVIPAQEQRKLPDHTRHDPNGLTGP